MRAQPQALHIDIAGERGISTELRDAVADV
jgi:hypothetical protein